MPPRLPFEIEEQIVDHLHDDPIALRACSLTCSAWVSLARLHLFWTADLTCQRLCVRFLVLLDSTLDAEDYKSTFLGEFVQVLRLPTFSLDKRMKNSGRRYEMVCRICRRLPNLRVLVVERFDWPHFIEHLCPDEDTVDIGDLLASVFAFPRLEQLRMRTLSYAIPGDVLQLISTFPNLSSLELVRLVGRARGGDDPPSTAISCGELRAAIRLQELIVDKWSSSIPSLRDLLENLFKPPFELRLRKLHWKTGDPDEDLVTDVRGVEEKVLTKLLYGANETLEELTLSLARDGQYAIIVYSDPPALIMTISYHTGWLGQPELPISGHRSLRKLALIFRFPRNGLVRWPSVPGFISRIHSDALRELNLQFMSLWDSFHWDCVDWDSMADALIILHRRHPSILFTFRFSFYISHRPMPVAVAPLKERLRRALEKGTRVVAFREGLGLDYVYNPSKPGVLDSDCGVIFSTRTEL